MKWNVKFMKQHGHMFHLPYSNGEIKMIKLLTLLNQFLLFSVGVFMTMVWISEGIICILYAIIDFTLIFLWMFTVYLHHQLLMEGNKPK